MIVVTTTTDVIDAGDGVTSLREALIQANSSSSDDEIQLSAATYTLTLGGEDEDAALTGDLDVLDNGSVRLVGVGAAQTIIDGTALIDRLFHVQDGARLDVDGVTLKGGYTDERGGGIYNYGGTLVIARSTFSDNTVGLYGGAIANAHGGTVAITESSFLGNVATKQFQSAGGAVCNIEGLVEIDSSSFTDNESYAGGVIYNGFLGTTNVTDSILNENFAYVGGAVYNRGGFEQSAIDGKVKLIGCDISRNVAGNAGAIDNNGGDLYISNCTINDNFAGWVDAPSYGGAIYLQDGYVTIEHSTISGNEATWGGGISVHYGTLNTNRTTISNNIAGHAGGGMNNKRGNLHLIGTTISGNSAEDEGGGLHNGDGHAELINSTISGNTAGVGGGIHNHYDGGIEIFSTTITGNRATEELPEMPSGGGLWSRNFSQFTTRLLHSIVAGNFSGTGTTADDISSSANRIYASANNLIGDAASAGGLANGVDGNIVGNLGTGTIPIESVLGPLADNGGPTQTHALVEGSPAVDAGIAIYNDPDQPYDQRGSGFARIGNGRIDIGAFEVQVEGESVAPIFTSAATTSVAENQTSVFTVVASDADVPADTLTFSISGGVDASRFGIHPSTGQLTFAAAPDFENPADSDGNNSYVVNVQVSDGTHNVVQTVTIAVTDINEAPTLTPINQTTTFSKKANKKNGTQLVPNIVVSDQDLPEGFQLGGGKMIFSLDAVGKTGKKGFQSFDGYGVELYNARDFSLFNGSTFVGKFLQYEYILNPGTTAAQVQTYLRSLKFFTSGKGLKVPTRTFRLQLIDAAGAVSNLFEQTINVTA